MKTMPKDIKEERYRFASQSTERLEQIEVLESKLKDSEGEIERLNKENLDLHNGLY